MKINSNTLLNVSIDKSKGNYISVRKKRDSLEITSTLRKPKGGARSTLLRIQQVLEVIPLDASETAILGSISKDIERGYSQKNAKKSALKRYLHRKHTKKVHQSASSIPNSRYNLTFQWMCLVSLAVIVM